MQSRYINALFVNQVISESQQKHHTVLRNSSISTSYSSYCSIQFCTSENGQDKMLPINQSVKMMHLLLCDM